MTVIYVILNTVSSVLITLKVEKEIDYDWFVVLSPFILIVIMALLGYGVQQ